MKVRVVKTSFEEEQQAKQEAWLKLTPYQRWEIAYKLRKLMRKPGVDYSFKGMKVKITRLP